MIVSIRQKLIRLGFIHSFIRSIDDRFLDILRFKCESFLLSRSGVCVCVCRNAWCIKWNFRFFFYQFSPFVAVCCYLFLHWNEIYLHEMIKMKFSLEMSVSLSLTVEFYYSVTFEYIFIEFNWEKIFFRFVSFRLLLFYRSCYILTSSDGERINILLWKLDDKCCADINVDINIEPENWTRQIDGKKWKYAKKTGFFGMHFSNYHLTNNKIGWK